MYRILYSILTIDLWREPVDSLRVMALWLWLEASGLHYAVRRILSLPHFLIDEIADEAMLCLNYLTNENHITSSAQHINIQQMQSVLGGDIFSKFFSKNQGDAFLGIEKIFSETCMTSLSDLLQIAKERNTARTLAETEIALSAFIEPGFSRLNIDNNDTRGESSINSRVNNTSEDLYPADRTMFVTFSRGYPVSELDIRGHFNLIYGDCIEAIYMQSVCYGEQPIYARMVFYTSHVIELILNGAEKAKFTINERHVWMRKYVPRHS